MGHFHKRTAQEGSALRGEWRKGGASWAEVRHLSACVSAALLASLLAGDAGSLVTGSHVTFPHRLPRLSWSHHPLPA